MVTRTVTSRPNGSAMKAGLDRPLVCTDLLRDLDDSAVGEIVQDQRLPLLARQPLQGGKEVGPVLAQPRRGGHRHRACELAPAAQSPPGTDRESRYAVVRIHASRSPRVGRSTRRSHARTKAVVHGLGPDDRERVPAPALAYFRRMQVAPTVAVAAAARRARVGTMVILGSYFSHFDRVRPGLDLAAAHPYIQARREQTAQARAAGPEVVTNLEIPFVFGAVPGVVPMWKSYLVDPLRRMPVGFVPRGTSAAVTDGDVAQAVSLALDGRIIGSMPIATDNYSFDRLARVMLGALGHPRRPVVGVPNGVLALGMRTEAARLRLKKMDSGLDLARLPHDLIGADLSLDTTDFGEAIGLSPRTIDDAVIATVRASQ